jgi:hypothetical protein
MRSGCEVNGEQVYVVPLCGGVEIKVTVPVGAKILTKAPSSFEGHPVTRVRSTDASVLVQTGDTDEGQLFKALVPGTTYVSATSGQEPKLVWVWRASVMVP